LVLLAGLALVIGLMRALIAIALMALIGLITNLVYYHRVSTTLVSPAANHLGVWAIPIPIIGGIIIGFMARYGSERIRGHGIPEAMETILTGGAFGSLVSQFLHLTAAERKPLLVAAAAAGMAATFNAPIASILLAVDCCCSSGNPAALFRWRWRAASRPWRGVPSSRVVPCFPSRMSRRWTCGACLACAVLAVLVACWRGR
jgi:H+/Cl- antiporter ClcA